MTSLRHLFRPSHAEIWRRLSTELGARYVAGSTWKGERLEVEHGQWVVTLDLETALVGKVPIPFTRLRAPYVNSDGFRFTIYRRTLASDVARWFGMQDVLVGHAAFDRDFIVKGNDERKLRRLCDDARLRLLLERQPQVRLTVLDDEGWFGARFPKGTDELRCSIEGVVVEKQRLQDLFELFGETLDHLCRMGSAYADDPGVDL